MLTETILYWLEKRTSVSMLHVSSLTFFPPMARMYVATFSMPLLSFLIFLLGFSLCFAVSILLNN